MIFVTYFMEILVLVPLVWLFGYFEFIGLISFGIAYITAFIGTFLTDPPATPSKKSFLN
jgi:hypothetical protein